MKSRAAPAAGLLHPASGARHRPDRCAAQASADSGPAPVLTTPACRRVCASMIRLLLDQGLSLCVMPSCLIWRGVDEMGISSAWQPAKDAHVKTPSRISVIIPCCTTATRTVVSAQIGAKCQGRRTSSRRAQCRRPPDGTGRSGAISTICPSASGTPSTSTSERTGPIWRGGRFTTASTCRPTKVSGV